MADAIPSAPESAPEAPSFGPVEPGHNDEFDTPYYEAEPAKTEPKVDAKPAADVKPAAEKQADDKPAEKVPEKKSEPVAAKHSEELIELALDLGASQEWIDRQSPAQLRSAVRTEIASRGREKAEPKKVEPAEDEIEFELGGAKKSLKVADLDENVAAFFKAQQAQIKQLTETLTKQQQTHEHRNRVAGLQAIEDTFAELDPAIFGKGGYGDLDKKSDEFLRRDFLVRSLNVDFATHTPAQIAKALKSAATRLFGASKPAEKVEAAPKVIEKELPDRDPETGQFVPKDEDADEIDRWRKGGLPGSTERESPPPRMSHREHALKNLSKELRKHGVVPNGTV